MWIILLPRTYIRQYDLISEYPDKTEAYEGVRVLPSVQLIPVCGLWESGLWEFNPLFIVYQMDYGGLQAHSVM